MPASRSSLTGPAFGHLADLAQLLAWDGAGLLTVLAEIADRRCRRESATGCQSIWGLAVCAALAGARSFTAIAEWAADADEATLAGLGVTGAVPSESTFRRALQNLDADALDAAAGAWAARRTQPRRTARRVIAVDGKTLRGSAAGGEDGRHLLAALDHAHDVVLGQAGVERKTNEIPMLPALLDRIAIGGAVITADALHAQREHALYLARRGAHYLLTVKGNQPGLHAQLKALPWRQVPVTSDTRGRSHGRREHRTLTVTAVAQGLAVPHAAQAIQVIRRRATARKGKKRKWHAETICAITSLTAAQASPSKLATMLRGHWAIEDQLHWIRDVIYDEDRSQIRTASGPRVMATLRIL
jgi:predicted transposase YbfD/YdcC